MTAYDLVISIGEACMCSSNLRKRGLQKFSYPLDWVFGATFAQRIGFVINKFHRYFEFKDLISLDRIDHDKYIIKNKYTALCHNHDFYINQGSWESQYDKVKAKYDRRISRLINMLESQHKQKVLIVYIEIPRTADNQHEFIKDKQLTSYIDELERVYPNKKFNLLYIKHNEEYYPNKFKYEQISKSINKAIIYNRAFKYTEGWESNNSNIQKVLAHYNITLKRNILRKIFVLLKIVLGI